MAKITKSSSDELCDMILAEHLKQGVDLQCIVAGANAYRQQTEDIGKPQLPLWRWLLQRGWEQHLN